MKLTTLASPFPLFSWLILLLIIPQTTLAVPLVNGTYQGNTSQSTADDIRPVSFVVVDGEVEQVNFSLTARSPNCTDCIGILWNFAANSKEGNLKATRFNDSYIWLGNLDDNIISNINDQNDITNVDQTVRELIGTDNPQKQFSNPVIRDNLRAEPGAVITVMWLMTSTNNEQKVTGKILYLVPYFSGNGLSTETFTNPPQSISFDATLVQPETSMANERWWK